MKPIRLLTTLLIVMFCTALTSCSKNNGVLKDGKITVKIEKAGSLQSFISDIDADKVYSLSVIGDINGTDISFIRELKILNTLDLSRANMVSGGKPYYLNYTTTDKVIGTSMFSGMTLLETVKTPNSVTSISDDAFVNCTGLTSITISKSVTSICYQAFSGCKGLTSITIPNNVTLIDVRAFMFCSALTSISIPNSVTSIGKAAFLGCSRLTSVTIPNSVTSISGMAFWGCSGLTSVTIPNSVTSISSSAFWGCSELTSVTIPNIVSLIGDYAFWGCSGLKEIRNNNAIPQNLNSTIFDGINKATCKLYVPKGSFSSYRAAPIWGDFTNIIEED